MRWRQLDVPRRGEAGFRLMDAGRTGITHRNDVSDEHALANRNLLIGAGVAAGDIDGDGLPDLFFGSLESPPALYHNLGDFRFADETKARGIDVTGLAITGAAFADVDGDGDLDLLAGTLGGPLKLWLNDGTGHFTDATASSGLDSGYAATTLTLADVNGDGALDLYVATYKQRNALDSLAPPQRGFDQVVRRVGNTYAVVPAMASVYRVEDRPDLGGVVRTQRAERDLFYMNDGHGHFTRVPLMGPRFRDENGKPIVRETDFFTLAARFYDFNGDGAPDLYVCNDFEDPDEIWLNDGHGNFNRLPPLDIRETSNTCMSVDFGDVDRDGHPDIFTADMLAPTLAERQRQVATHTPLPKQVGLTPDRGQWMRNMLQHARGDGTFAQVGDLAGVSASDWTWGSAFVDVDLDGYEDLLVVNGHRWDIRDADTYERIRNSIPRIPWNREQGEFPRLATHSVAFHNRGDLTFDDASARWNFGRDAAISHGMALADIDGDGDLDVVVTRLDAPAVVYRNETNAPRLAVRLREPGSNSRGIGALVTVRAAGLPVQSREMTAGGYYLSGSEPMLTFATGRDTAPSITVRWRDGHVDSVNARPNRLYEIAETAHDANGRGNAANGGASADRDRPAGGAPRRDPGRPLFADATALLGGHRHVDQPFDDYDRQPLLLNKFSQLGPGVAWVDLDGNGAEDLIVGTGRGGRLGVFMNRGKTFQAALTAGPVAPWDLTTIVPVPDKGGRTRLLVGQSSYEAATPAQALAVPSVVGIEIDAHGSGSPAVAVIPGDTASVGPLAVGDLNGDGLLDLFVGARVEPGAWPVAKPSRLYLRSPSGGWVADTQNADVMRGLGLVSAAVWADINGDGWPDLVTTSEWGPIRVLLNDHGRLHDATATYGLDKAFSRWNGVAVGDFDGDGRLDIVATSWGRNTPWHASPERPHELYVGRFGAKSAGLLFARRDSVTGASMPLESFARIGAAIPAIRERIATYADFAGTSVDQMLKAIGASATRLGATTYDHTLFLNRGGTFEAHALPLAAQVAPAFGVVVADFDGDGHEDLFLAENFSPTDIETPRLDAGSGQVLLGDGHGGFRVLAVPEAGIRVLGDGRGAAAADYDGDGRVDLVVPQNGDVTTLWRNVGAVPGLRVRLDGGADNPAGVGAALRLVHAGARGPAVEIHAGSGYWSVDAPTVVLGGGVPGDSVWVRWPGGREQVTAVNAVAGTLVIRAVDAAAAARTSSR